MDQRALPGPLPNRSRADVWRAVGLFALLFALAVAIPLVLALLTDLPDWVGPAVSGGMIGFGSVVILGRLVRGG